MKKYLIAFTFALFASSSANASFIEAITGGDLAGIKVSVFYDNGDVETAPWIATSLTEGSASSFFTGGWSLTLAGDSYDNAWEFYTGAPLIVPEISSFAISLLDTDFVFDTEDADNGDGSGPGLSFSTSYVGTPYSYFRANGYAPGLYRTIGMISEGEGLFPDFVPNTAFTFTADIDAIAEDDPNPNPNPNPNPIPEVSAPASTTPLILGLLGMLLVRRQQQSV